MQKLKRLRQDMHGYGSNYVTGRTEHIRGWCYSRRFSMWNSTHDWRRHGCV